MKKIRLFAATALLATAAISGSFAQTNLGADCGCPPITSRDVVLMSSLTKDTLVTFNGVSATYTIMAAKNTVLTCQHLYTLDRRIYVKDGQSLTIQPGSVLRGTYTNDVDPNSLIIARGGKIFADGTATCPIVMTSVDDPMDGSYPICSAGRWGGLVILGKATNNLVAANTLCATINSVKVPGVGYVEGFTASNPYNLFGAANGAFDDNDNSGILRYVTVKAAGTEVSANNELNGISLGSVGRGTTIEHIEIVGNQDDGIEFFGGTVNVKYVAMWWVNDDMFDWDLGWRGNGQFLFGIQGGQSVRTAPNPNGADSGFESDGEDNNVNSSYQSHPVIYNATFIGDGQIPTVGGPSGPSAIRGKDRGEGEVYNSIFANFRYGFDVNDTESAGSTTYDNWVSRRWLVVNNDFVNIYGGLGAFTVTPPSPGTRASATTADLATFAADGNLVVSTIAGFSYPADLLVCGTPGSISAKFDAQPNPERRGTAAPVSITPLNGFFKPVSYRGAFGVAEGNWLEGWSFGVQNSITNGVITGPGDINKSGSVNSTDLNEILNNYGVTYSKK
jgi:hypothetical protein